MDIELHPAISLLEETFNEQGNACQDEKRTKK